MVRRFLAIAVAIVLFVGTATAVSTVPAGAAVDISALEAQWAARRAAIVARIRSNGWGLQSDGHTIAGPNGFRIDTSRCVGGWNNVDGLTDKIGRAHV